MNTTYTFKEEEHFWRCSAKSVDNISCVCYGSTKEQAKLNADSVIQVERGRKLKS